MKKILMLIFIILFIIICIFSFFKISNKKDTIIGTAIPIYDVVEKFCNNDEYYLTVAFEDYFIEQYKLPKDKLTFKVKESIYNKVIVNSGFVGISLTIKIPYNEPKIDIGTILRENHTNYCKIVRITSKDNISID